MAASDGWVQGRSVAESLIATHWVTNDGQVVQIKDMDTNHIIFAYRMVQRRRMEALLQKREQPFGHWIRGFEKEMERRGRLEALQEPKHPPK
jgi:hypothetical protein